MEKSEILERARKENKGADMAELAVQSKAHGIAGAAVLLLCALLNLIASLVSFERRSFFFQIMFCSYNAIFGIVRFIAGKRRRIVSSWSPVWLAYGLLMTVFTVIFLCFMLRNLKAGII